jgi:hypothetical protein
MPAFFWLLIADYKDFPRFARLMSEGRTASL